MRALAWRELRNHWLALSGAVLLALCVGLLNAMAQGLRAEAPTAFGPLAAYVQVVIPLVALVTARRLVAHEHRARTRMLLASLPVDPVLTATVKLALTGLTVVLTGTGLVGLCAALGSPRPETALTLRVMGRVGLFSVCAACAAFLCASTGRYLLVSIVGPLVLSMVVPGLVYAVHPWSPFGVVPTTLATDPRPLGPGLGVCTVSLSVGAAAAGLALSRVRSGALAAALFTRMSHGEAMRWTLGLALPLLLYHPDRHRVTRYTLPGAVTIAVAGTAVAYVPGSTVDEALARSVARALPRAARIWPGRPLPRVVLLAHAAVPEGCVRIDRPSDESVLVRYPPMGPGTPRDTLDTVAATVTARALQGVALAITRGDAAGGDTAWVLEGAGRYLAVGTTTPDALSLARAFAVTQGGALDPQDLAAWGRVRESLGDDGAESVAASLLQVAAARQGEAAVTAMLRAALAPRWADSMLASWWAPSARTVWHALGMSPDGLVTQWKAAVQGAGSPGKGVTRITPRWLSRGGRGLTRTVGVRVDAVQGLADSARVAVAVWRLGPEGPALARGLPVGDVDDDERVYDGAFTVASLRDGVWLPVTMAAGDRVLWRAVPLGASVVVGAGLRRTVVR